jgi:hypothetical protein
LLLILVWELRPWIEFAIYCWFWFESWGHGLNLRFFVDFGLRVDEFISFYLPYLIWLECFNSWHFWL